MTTIAVASLHGAPGATTLAAALATHLGATLAEADPSGGVLAARCGLSREPGLVTLAADRFATGAEVLQHAQLTASDLRVMPCPDSAEHAAGMLRAAADDLAERLDGAGTVVVDVGRLGLDGLTSPFLGRATAVILCSRPTVEDLSIVRSRLNSLRRFRPLLVLVGDRPYGPAEVAAELEVRVTACIANDPRGVDAMWSGRRARGMSRTPFARTVHSLASVLGEALHELEGARP